MVDTATTDWCCHLVNLMASSHNNCLYIYSDHSPDNVIFHDISLTVRGTPAHVKCYLYQASTSAIVSGGVGMQ